MPGRAQSYAACLHAIGPPSPPPEGEESPARTRPTLLINPWVAGQARGAIALGIKLYNAGKYEDACKLFTKVAKDQLPGNGIKRFRQVAPLAFPSSLLIQAFPKGLGAPFPPQGQAARRQRG